MKKIDRFCKYCNELLNERHKIYCNNSCQQAYQYEQKIAAWLSGEWIPTNYELPNPIRRFLLEEAGYRCTSPTCSTPGGWSGVNPISGKSTLTIDHADGNADNNARSNLRVLCPNCHSLTPTFGGLNKGSGRKNRRR